MTPSYAGIGSRDTPAEVCAEMTKIAVWLGRKGYRLRSGGARGADQAFQLGAPPERCEVFLPWPGFEGQRTGILVRDPEA